jgi:hypothetical protein|tara:strand:+ start:261 stop:1025 length:765 start_codon:yes stop_codon:yes gene_type:complete
MIDREQFIQEQQLRKFVRRAIKHVHDKRLEEEVVLRSLVSKLIKEAAVSDTPPHGNTGINALKQLLKNTNILKVLKDGFKSLTTDPEQRRSFRAHVINGVQNILAPARTLDDAEEAGGMMAEPALAEAIEVDVEEGTPEIDEEDAFIDVEGEEKEEEDKFGIPGKDITGRNFAEDAFKQIEQPIVDKYEVLGSPEDQEHYYSYLLTNLKLYFDKWEEELEGDLDEPTTPEYEEEKSEQDTLDVGGADAAGDLDF